LVESVRQSRRTVVAAVDDVRCGEAHFMEEIDAAEESMRKVAELIVAPGGKTNPPAERRERVTDCIGRSPPSSMPARSWRAIADSEVRVNSDLRDAVARAEFLRAGEFTAAPLKTMRRSGLRSVPASAQSGFNASPPASRQVHAQVWACPSRSKKWTMHCLRLG
jgi:hypothetical protein